MSGFCVCLTLLSALCRYDVNIAIGLRHTFDDLFLVGDNPAICRICHGRLLTSGRQLLVQIKYTAVYFISARQSVIYVFLLILIIIIRSLNNTILYTLATTISCGCSQCLDQKS